MKPPRSDDFADQRKTVSDAKKALLERAKAVRSGQAGNAKTEAESDAKSEPSETER